MSTLIDINIPYASGLTNSTSGSATSNKNGFGWCWFGGNNGRKIFSLRIQQDEDYWFVEVSEADDLQAEPMTKTVLYTHAINSAVENLHTDRDQVVEMCRLSSSAVYVKIHTGFGGENCSEHFVIEIDESNGNEVSVTPVTEQMPDWLKGGSYHFTSKAAYSSGQGVHHRFMHQLAENKIITFEASNSSSFGAGSLVERSWDPVTKYLTNRIVSSQYRNPTIRAASWRTTEKGYGDTWSFVPELDKRDFQVMRPSVDSPDNVTNYDDFPVLHGDNTDMVDQNWGSYPSVKNVRWFNVVTGRDGLVHIILTTEYTGSQAVGSSGGQNWSTFNGNLSHSKYVHTYNPADGSWGLTGRSNDDQELPSGNDDFCVFLPLNTMTTSDYATAESIDTNEFNGVTNSRVFKTWMFVGGDSMQVQGVEAGSPQSYENEHPMDQSLQAIWLDYDHFMVIGWQDISSNLTSYYKNTVYTIIRYYDENKIEVVSSDNTMSGIANNSERTHTHCGGNIFQRPTANTLLSDRYGAALITISAGSAPADSDGS
jgi:hypothetical protein